MEKADMILEGSEFVGKEFHGSFAEYMIPKMKSHPKDSISQIDCKTGETITSQEFLRQSIQIAEGLHKFGLQRGEIVVMAAENHIKSYLVTMGVMFSNGVLAPLNRNLKPREMEPLLAQLEPKYIICETEKAKFMLNSAKAVNLQPKIIIMDSPQGLNGEFYGWNDIVTEVDLDTYTPRSVEDPKKDLLFICCSSGSTGLPKGVALSHYSIVFSICLMESLHIEGLSSSILIVSPLYWISGLLLLIKTSISGETRYLPTSCDPGDLLEDMQKYKPVFLLLSPAALLFLVEHPNFKKYNLDSIKVVMVGGSILGKNVADKIKAIWKDVLLLQAYGMTEVGGGITSPPENRDIETVGKLTPEIKVKVVDPSTNESLGPNKVGEIRLKTKRIMNGYYNNEKATRDAFDENGWYRTGDLGYYNEDGLIYVVGRIKEVVKYKNHQIYPAEIESFINSLPGVKDAAIVPIYVEPDGYHLKAVVVRHPDSDITEDDIIKSVKENFSDFKHLRKGVEFVDNLPRTEIGKLKRSEIFNIA